MLPPVKKKKIILYEARMGQILHTNEGSLFVSSLQSRYVTPSLRMLPDLAQKISELSAAGGKPGSWRSIVKAWPDLTLFQPLLLPESAVQNAVLFWPDTVSFQNNFDKLRNWSREYCWAFQLGLEQWPTKNSSFLQYSTVFLKNPLQTCSLVSAASSPMRNSSISCFSCLSSPRKPSWEGAALQLIGRKWRRFNSSSYFIANRIVCSQHLTCSAGEYVWQSRLSLWLVIIHKEQQPWLAFQRAGSASSAL